MLSFISEIKRWSAHTRTPFSLMDNSDDVVVKKQKHVSYRSYRAITQPSLVLTQREKQVCDHLVNGNSTYKGIGSSLGISPRTVEFYLNSLREKVGAPNKRALKRKLAEYTFVEFLRS